MMKIASLLLWAVFCSCFLNAANVEVWECKDIAIPVSTERISDNVKTEEQFTRIRFHQKVQKKLQFDLNQSNLDVVFDEAAKNPVKDEAFFGPGKNYILLDNKSGSTYLVFVESSALRFQIAPLTEVGGGCFVATRFAYVSRNPEILEACGKASK